MLENGGLFIYVGSELIKGAVLVHWLHHIWGRGCLDVVLVDLFSLF